MIIKCKYWSASERFFRGRCSAGKYDGVPSFGHCIDRCKMCENTREELNEYIKTLPVGPAKPGCGGCESVKNFVAGFGRLAYEKIAKPFGGQTPKWVLDRMDQCGRCEFRTLLDIYEWATQGIDLRKIERFEGVLADQNLPINTEPGEGKYAFCAVCKCLIDAAIRAKEKPCPAGKFDKHTEPVPETP